jgi:hypothetical protein
MFWKARTSTIFQQPVRLLIISRSVPRRYE